MDAVYDSPEDVPEDVRDKYMRIHFSKRLENQFIDMDMYLKYITRKFILYRLKQTSAMLDPLIGLSRYRFIIGA